MNLNSPPGAFDEPGITSAKSDGLLPLALSTNPFWAILRGWFNTKDPAYAPTLWNRGPDGTFSPSIDPATGQPFPVSEAVQNMLNQYNDQNARLNQANRNAIDAVLNRFMPVSDVWYRELTDFSLSQLISDASWLADHEQGSYFYQSLGPNVDELADSIFARFKANLTQACLAVDYAEVEQKVISGVASPIVIDLAGDGIETTSFLAGPSVIFDIDGDGAKDRTAWLTGKDAFLAVDKNGNGTIDGVNEMFGGLTRGEGFAQLSEFDSNNDGFVNQNDDRFSELLLWKDTNVDGLTDDGELVSASTSGLESISTDYLSQDVRNNGNILGEVSTAIYQGQSTTAVDVYFRFKTGAEASSARNFDSLASAMATFQSFSSSDPLRSQQSDVQPHITVPVTSHFLA